MKAVKYFYLSDFLIIASEENNHFQLFNLAIKANNSYGGRNISLKNPFYLIKGGYTMSIPHRKKTNVSIIVPKRQTGKTASEGQN